MRIINKTGKASSACTTCTTLRRYTSPTGVCRIPLSIINIWVKFIDTFVCVRPKNSQLVAFENDTLTPDFHMYWGYMRLVLPVFDSHHPKATNRPYATASSWQGQQTVCGAAHPKTQLSPSYMGDVEYYWCLRWTVEKKPNAWCVAERIPSSQVPRGKIAFSCASGAALIHSHLSADSCVSGTHCLNVAEW